MSDRFLMRPPEDADAPYIAESIAGWIVQHRDRIQTGGGTGVKQPITDHEAQKALTKRRWKLIKRSIRKERDLYRLALAFQNIVLPDLVRVLGWAREFTVSRQRTNLAPDMP